MPGITALPLATRRSPSEGRRDLAQQPAPALELLVVEDHLALRRGLKLLLENSGFRIVGAAGSVRDARELLMRRRHDVALIDVTLSDGSSIDLLRETLKNDPDAPIVMYTGSEDSRLLRAAIDMRVHGLVSKSAPPAVLIAALKTVAGGGDFMDPDIRRVMGATPAMTAWADLSDRQREVIELLAIGLNGEQIAERLLLSPQTVKTHIRNAIQQLGANTRAHAVALTTHARALARDDTTPW